MTTKFWEKVGEGIAGLWSAQALTLSFAFWATGLLFWMLQDPQRMYGLFMPEGIAIALLVGGLIVVALSSWVVQRLSLPLLRWFEGYWLIKPLRFWMARRVNGWLEKKEQTWDRLAKGYKEGTLTAEEMESYAHLDTELAAYPVDERLRMPTQIGNLLRAAEEYPGQRYGLNLFMTWPHLWLVLPEGVQKELSEAHKTLAEQASLLLWGVLFAAWCGFSRGMILVAVVIACIGLWEMRTAAGVYAQLVRAAYDLHRFDLYRKLEWPLPKTAAREKAAGEGLTLYLQRGSMEKIVVFARPEEK